ncbi:MAG: pirin family protein [Cyanobacteria bacterium J06623_5]
MPSRSAIAQLIVPEKHDLGGFSVRRSLPNESRTMVGPFIFFDHLGPAVFPPGKGVDVRPHPHINLATVTYLFEGSLLHRDSLGVVQEILPGAVNWMTAGKGVVHSERSPQSFRETDATLHAIQTWIALPESEEEIEPNFSHHAATELPTWEESYGDARTSATLIAGTFGPYTSPVETFSPTLYLALRVTAGSRFSLPASPLERGIYSVTAGLQVDGEPLEQYRLALLAPDADVEISAGSDALCMVVGGESLGTRHKYWNFVSSRPKRIEQAKQDWREQRFPQVPGETEFIPLPD